jgi:serine/threonine protein kinase
MNINDWEIPYEEVSINFQKILGRGEFSIVYEGTWRNLKVAVKYFNPECDESLVIHLAKELQVLIKIHHPHIIQVLGVCFKPFLILLEYMEYGDLYKQMDRYRLIPNIFMYPKKKSWCRQICLALNYLHLRKPEQIIHRDLKPTNILITVNNVLKLSDFGISKIVRNSFNDLHQLDYTTNVGTYTYMSPEVMFGTNKYNQKADIYSLGLIFYEIWESRRWFFDLEISSLDDLKSFVKKGIRLKFSSTPKKFIAIINHCISFNPDARPDASAILNAIG